MTRYVSVVGVLVICLGAGTVIDAQKGKGKIMLQRMLPPAVELEARPFGIDATSQVQGGDAAALAASFKELFRAKIQGDGRFVYTPYSPALRISIAITRYYVEPKQLSRPDKSVCQTHTGSLQGTFQVVEVASGKPLASDTIGWSLQTGQTKQWLVSADGLQMLNIKGPNEKLTLNDAWGVFEPDPSISKGINLPFIGGHRSHPCDLPLTQNEARHILADAFMTEIVQMAMPYQKTVEVPVFSNKAIARPAEDARAGEWSKALDGGLGIQPLPDVGDESQRLYLIGLSYEALGYREGQLAFDINKQLQTKLPADELTKLQAELRRKVDLTKEHFDKASMSFNQANVKKAEEDYRQGERRAEQSRRLYARIQKYRDLQPISMTKREEPPLRMPDILAMCNQGVDETIIEDLIDHASKVEIVREEFKDLAQCGDRQKALYKKLAARLQAQAKGIASGGGAGGGNSGGGANADGDAPTTKPTTKPKPTPKPTTPKAQPPKPPVTS
jgi:hypothetical protein